VTYESPEIEQIRAAEEHNYGISRETLGTTFELADDCGQLYESLPPAEAKAKQQTAGR
jgi:hypothetical protein